MRDPLTCDAITATFSLFQRARGHRFSFDDRVTAYVAARVGLASGARRVLDLGTGIGSVLHMVASSLVSASFVGIEAQETSFALLEKNLAHNALGARARAIFGDLRTETPKLEAGTFDLVTGTPPYLPIGTATPSPDGQRAAARIELRGGIEAYLTAAAYAVSPTGTVVVCADGRTPERTRDAARAAGLVVREVLHVLAREVNTTPLFSVWTLVPGRLGAETETEEARALRDTEGNPTPFTHEIVAFFGLDGGA